MASEIIERLETSPRKRLLHRGAALVLTVPSLFAGLIMALAELHVWPLLATGYLLFIAYCLWIGSCWSLEIGSDGITLERPGKQFFVPWSQVSEFAPGNGIDRHKVEIALQGEPPLATAYQGLAKLKPRHPRFLPDTFGLSAKDLANRLNDR
jgi:hypothetical protein